MNETTKILVTDDVHELLVDGLKAIGEVVYEPGISYEDVCKISKEYDGLVINSKIIVDQDFLKHAPRLKWVGRLGSGLDIVDLPAAAAAGVEVINSPEGNANAVGEHALGMLLCLLNNLQQGDRMVRSLAPWNRESVRGRELNGLTVGVIGCGHTGSAFVKKLQGFDVDVLLYDKYKGHLPNLHRSQRVCDFPDVIAQSDVVSLHLPLTEETRGWVDGAFLDQMKADSILINTSRGAIVNLADVVLRLASGRLSGLCMDVFENEKPATYSDEYKQLMAQLSASPHTVLSPHVAGWTVESKQKIAEILLNRIIYAHSKL